MKIIEKLGIKTGENKKTTTTKNFSWFSAPNFCFSLPLCFIG
jgi:hypothetical protein